LLSNDLKRHCPREQFWKKAFEMSHYSNYHGKCIGRILHFLYHYCGSNVASNVTIGETEIKLDNEPFAMYKWHDSIGLADVPVFEFLSINNFENNECALSDVRYLYKVQIEKRDEAIEDSLFIDHGQELYKSQAVINKNSIRILKRDAFVFMNMWASILEKEYFFFTAKSNEFEGLFAEVEDDYVYKWDDECNNWIKWENVKPRK